jgi:hypothetical protein
MDPAGGAGMSAREEFIKIYWMSDDEKREKKLREFGERIIKAQCEKIISLLDLTQAKSQVDVTEYAKAAVKGAVLAEIEKRLCFTTERTGLGLSVTCSFEFIEPAALKATEEVRG